MERVELHCHSKYSEMDGLASPYDIVKLVQKEGMPAVAITDTGNILMFPELEWATSFDDCNVKPIFGMEAYVVDDYEKAVYNYNGQDISVFIAVDVETTGFSVKKNDIIEIGAVKVCNGEVVDRFSILVNPGKNISKFIEKITGISNEMVSDAPDIKVALREFCKFAGDNILVAYNANFDIRFLKVAANKAGVDYCPTYIDTLMLCRYVYPEFQIYKLDSVCEELGINIQHCHRAVDDATACGMIFSKITERLKIKNVAIEYVNDNIEHCSKTFEKSAIYHCTVLLKNSKGKKIIYNMISQEEKSKATKGRVIFSLRELCNNRGNLLLGSGCKAGLLYKAIINDKSEEEIEEIAKRFDFIEVQPHMNNKFLLEQEIYSYIQTEQDLIDINQRLISLGERLGIPVVATADAHYLHKEDLLSRNILRAYRGFDEDDDTDLHFRTTKEMLEEFFYLPDEKARKIVITNTNKIANMCEVIDFLPEGKHYPYNENDSIEIRRLCESKLWKIYKDNVPEEIEERLNWELEAIHNTNTEFAFIYLHRLIENLNVRPFEINTRGCAGNTLVCFLLGISDINPIQYNLSPYFVFGFNKIKEADIDLNFSTNMRKKAIAIYRNCDGISSTVLASTEICVSEEMAYVAVEDYQKNNNVIFSEDKVKKIVIDLQNVYEDKRVNPSGIVLIPQGDEVQDYTPLAFTKDKRAITYFNYYYRLDNCLFKQDILSHFCFDMLEKLEEITGDMPDELTYCEPEIMELFFDFNGVMGCEELPDFMVQGLIEILKKAMPKNFDELVKVFALCYGTDVWSDNAELLLEQGKADLSEIISSRDDMYDFMINKGIDEATAYLITEQVRKGEWAYDHSNRYSEYIGILQDAAVPEWFIWSCCKIRYLFPRAQAISYVKSNWRLGWYKIHYSEQYTKIVEDFISIS